MIVELQCLQDTNEAIERYSPIVLCEARNGAAGYPGHLSKLLLRKVPLQTDAFEPLAQRILYACARSIRKIDVMRHMSLTKPISSC